VASCLHLHNCLLKIVERKNKIYIKLPTTTNIWQEQERNSVFRHYGNGVSAVEKWKKFLQLEGNKSENNLNYIGIHVYTKKIQLISIYD